MMIHKVLQDPLGSITGPKKIDQDLIAINVAMTNRVRYRVATQLIIWLLTNQNDKHEKFQNVMFAMKQSRYSGRSCKAGIKLWSC